MESSPPLEEAGARAFDAIAESSKAMDRYDPALRAIITRMDHQARDAASSIRAEGSFAGTTVAVKDNVDVAGVRATYGSAFFRDNVPTNDAFVIARLKEAGALITAKTNLDEFGFGATTQNLHWGSCRNPWNTDHIPGGSSGGSAVAVVSGMAEVALGTDTGGSVRIPAAFNGLVGLRPTLGRVSKSGVFPFSPAFDTVGPITRTAMAAAEVLDVIDSYDRRDTTSMRGRREPATPHLHQELTGLRVGVPGGYFGVDVDPGVLSLVSAFVETLRTLGCDVLPVALPAAGIQETMAVMTSTDAAVLHADRMADSPDTFSSSSRVKLQAGVGRDARDYARALHRRRSWQRSVEDALDQVDVMVTPTAPVDVPTVRDCERPGVKQDLLRFTMVWSMHAGPSISVPCGFHPTSMLPVGAHLTAAPWRDHLLLRVAHQYQSITTHHEANPTLLAPRG